MKIWDLSIFKTFKSLSFQQNLANCCQQNKQENKPKSKQKDKTSIKKKTQYEQLKNKQPKT